MGFLKGPILTVYPFCVYGISCCYLLMNGERSRDRSHLNTCNTADDLAAHLPALRSFSRAIEIYRSFCPSLSSTVFEVFLEVAACGPVGPMEIARSLGIAQPVATGALDILEFGGRKSRKKVGGPCLITRIGDVKDARLRLAAITPRGSQLVAAMLRARAPQ